MCDYETQKSKFIVVLACYFTDFSDVLKCSSSLSSSLLRFPSVSFLFDFDGFYLSITIFHHFMEMIVTAIISHLPFFTGKSET